MTVSLAGRELHPVDPATLEPLGTVAATLPEALGEVIAEASLAQARWARTPFRERRRVLGLVARYVLDRADEIALTITAETGKPVVEAYSSELFVAIDNLMWIAGATEGALAEERVPFPQPYLRHKKGWILHEPLGVVAVIAPWNFPFSIPFTQAAMAVAAGNAVVVKPAGLTPRSGAWVERCFDEAGAPEGLVRVVQGDGENVGAALVRARGVAKVFFTGSGEAGREVAASAGRELRPVVLELGGKDPMLVLDDADVDRAVAGALWGGFSNCGQVCSGVERVYVARPLHDEFVAELARRAGALRIGRGTVLTTELGPLVSERGRAKVERLVADAVERGAEIVTGAGRPPVGLPGWFHEPTVLTRVPRGAALEREEVFGPVVTVEPFRTEEEAVRLANDSPFGLGASVWTRDAERAARVARRLEAGSVWTNDVAYSYGTGQAPWGGRKASGFGRTHSRYGFHELTQLKFVDADSGRVPVPWWFPYGPRSLEGFRGIAGLLFGDGFVPRAVSALRHGRGLAYLGRRYLGR